MKNIVLIGMPGAGKSTVGVILAKALGYHFIDSDLLIQEKEGKLLKDIIEEEGLERFLAIENKVNLFIDTERSVIATGGSAVFGTEAMEYFHACATVVYLKIGYEELKERVGDPKMRGVALKENKSLLDLYEERCPLYEKYAHFTVDAADLKEGIIMEKIKSCLKIQ